MGEEAITLAEREYQRRLAALHATRADLAEVDAALRRLTIDRPRLGDEAEARTRDLRRQRDQLLAQADAQRSDAQAQRELVQRIRGPVEPEPIELRDDPADPPEAGFVQPPFSEPQ